MISITRLLVAILLIGLGVSQASAQFALYDEPYRGGFHFSPATNWTNEPNGLVYHDGLYHLFYQENAFNNQFGNQSWGHATSPDLLHWTQQQTAITPSGGKLIYSGSAVVDHNNTAGFGAGALVAAYTGFDPLTGVQDQRLAFSNDGFNFTKFAPPVIESPQLQGVEIVESRDPKVFWHEPTSAWKMVLSHGGQKKASLWSSPDLKSWTRTQDFFAPQIANQVGGWEVPDLFELPIDGNTNNTKWVLSITPSSGSPAGGNGVMYFIGDYDGHNFTQDTSLQPLNEIRWADYGRDFDGQQAWSNTPDGKTIWTSIMQSYGESVPTSPWRGLMAFPREVGLATTSQGIELTQKPIDQITSLRIPGESTILNNVLVTPGSDPLDSLNLQHDSFEIIATIDPQQSSSVGFQVREGSNGDKTTVIWNRLIDRMIMDRSNSGLDSFHPDADGVHISPLFADSNGKVTLRALVDKGSIELFGGQGESVISNLIFPDSTSQGISLVANGSSALFESIEIHPLRNIWPDQPVPSPGTSTVARWSMLPTPIATIQDGQKPAVIDGRTLFGEGTDLGTTNTLYEPTAAVDNLFISRTGNGGLPLGTAPPATMFANGNNGGTTSFDAGALSNENGALFLPVDRYGEESAFTDAFTVEMFFRTDGDQSGAGLMQLLLAGEDNFRYGLIMNEGGPGNIRFALNDRAGTIPILDTNTFSAKNFADGQWHYLIATFDPTIGSTGELRMVIASEDGSQTVASSLITNNFNGLPTTSGDGNLLIGRHQFSLAGDHRTFLGLIDEVQLSDGIVPAGMRLGAITGFGIGGDFNNDGIVNAADYTVWRNQYGDTGPSLDSDANGNGVVDQLDYEIWVANYAISTSSTSTVSVPEPFSLFYLLLSNIYAVIFFLPRRP